MWTLVITVECEINSAAVDCIEHTKTIAYNV